MNADTRNVRTPKIEARTLMQTVVSLSLLGAALYAILSHRYDANTLHWAFATAGTVLGFWLPSGHHSSHSQVRTRRAR